MADAVAGMTGKSNPPTLQAPLPQRRVPVRTCVVCRQRAAKRELVRIVRTPHGVQVDSSGKLNGRGAYLCDRKDCWERAVTTEVLTKALRSPLTTDDRNRLREAMTQVIAS